MARGTRPAPVQAIVGEDSYLAEAALERVVRQAIGEERSEALKVVYGDEQRRTDGGGWAAVLASARTGSLFASRRAILVRRADMFPEDRGSEEGSEVAGAKREEARPKDRKKADEHPLIEYLGDPSPDVTLVLVATRPDRRRKPWARLLKRGADAPDGVVVHDVAPMKRPAVRAYVEQELRRRELRFSREALELLLEEVGQDLRRLMGEVDKLEAWARERKEISLDDVATVLGRGLEKPLYMLSDAFSQRGLSRSLELLEELLADKTGDDRTGAGLRILVTLHRSLRQVRGAVALREAGTPRAQIGARLLPPNMQFKLDALVDASRQWSERDLGRALAVLSRTDRRIKRGADAAVALTSAVVAACGGGAATSPPRAR